MMKELIEFIQLRVHSPLYINTLIASIIMNWQDYLLLYAGTEFIEDRINEFAINTDIYSLIIYPLCWGIILSILYPILDTSILYINKFVRVKKNEILIDSKLHIKDYTKTSTAKYENKTSSEVKTKPDEVKPDTQSPSFTNFRRR